MIYWHFKKYDQLKREQEEIRRLLRGDKGFSRVLIEEDDFRVPTIDKLSY